MKILLVDDDEGILITTSEILRNFSYTVDTALSGQAALDLIAVNSYDIVVSDYKMPGLNGIEFIRKTKELKTDLMFIMTTGVMDMSIPIEALRVDVFDFLLKPVNIEKLVGTIDAAYKEKERRSKKESLISNLQGLAQKDALTGLNSKSNFEGIYRVEVERAKTHKRELSCILFGIDNMKAVNEGPVPNAGITVVKAIAALAAQNLSKINTFSLCRWGGEEFIVLLPESNMSGAINSAENLRKAVEAYVLKTPSGEIKVTISCGVSSLFKGPDRVSSSIIIDADRAFQDAKKRGGNCVVNI